MKAALMLAASLWALSAHAQEVALTTPVSGVVAEVAVKLGDKVRKGQVLARLDATIYRARVQEAKAAEQGAAAEEAEAKRNLDRAQQLYRRTVSSTTELEAAQLRYARAQSALGVDQARRVIAEKQLEEATLRAPFDGVVTKRVAEPGMVVAAQCDPKPLIVMERR